jgi:thiosulfate reductase/polysulfide reductase chain A
MAEVADGRVTYVQGNPHAAGIKGALCARGAAGTALTNDPERPQYPMIREGERGEGKWKKVSWDEALDYVANRLTEIQEQHGKNSVLFSDRGGPFRDFYRAWLKGIGTINYCNHDSACARNVQHAALSTFGFGRKGVAYDLKNAKHVVLQSRNIFEAINVKEVNDLLDAMENGCKLTVIDVRANVPASKADNFFLIRPGTDYAFNLAVINVLINEGLYDSDYVHEWFKDFDKLRNFVKSYTPQWAEQETGCDAKAIADFARQLAKAAPSVIWHPGWMVARYSDSFQVCRTAYIINALLGAIGAKGGLPLVAKPGDVDRKGLKSFMDLFPKPEGQRADGVGWMEGRKHFEAGPGLVNFAYDAIETGEPYPIKAYIAQRHDPLMAFPDVEDVLDKWKNLELLVSVTFSWSDTAWYSDVVLPMSPYLERESIIMTKAGLKPHFGVRFRAQEPIYDTKAEWEIYAGLAKRMGLEELDYDNIQDIWKFQLEGTGVSIEDFKKTGQVSLTDTPVYKPIKEGVFKTPSGKIEMLPSILEEDGIDPLPAYVGPAKAPQGKFRITFGRCGVHTQGHTVNNALLFEQMPENVLWMNTDKAKEMGIADGQYVTVSGGKYSGKMQAYTTDFMHPDAVFMVHGFGHTLPVESRAKDRGVADNQLMPEGIENYDKSGGGISMQEHFVSVSPA